jgi:hypothetical protein
MVRVGLRFMSSFSLIAVSTVAWGQGFPGVVRPQPSQKPSAALPATSPATTRMQAVPAAQISVVIQSARPARVVYAGGLLTVTADNSSLNQILHEISRLSNLKITGGVADERVYGIYGPALMPAVLVTLLNGTGSNMFLIQDASAAPRELVLTPRQGGASPPNPMAGRGADPDDEIDLPPQLTPRVSNALGGNPRGVNPPHPQQWQPSAIPSANGATAPVQVNPAPVTTTPEMTTEHSPNGVKTPQQIYEQLMRMQQQQPKPPQ